MSIGYLYCFSNRSMPSILKIGVTTREPLIRLKEANMSDTWRPPTPYEMEFAKKVISPMEKETILHTILAKYTERVNPNREFFRASVEEVKKLFDLIDGDYYNNLETINRVKQREKKDDMNQDIIKDINENKVNNEYSQFTEWLTYNCLDSKSGKVSLRELSEKSGLSECKIKDFMKKNGYKYYNFRFSSDENGNYDQGGYKDITMLYFTEKI